jgi:hypothetical protein
MDFERLAAGSIDLGPAACFMAGPPQHIDSTLILVTSSNEG